MMDCGDIFVRVAGRTPAQLVKTIFHETHHVKTMREAEQNIFHPSEINEARAEWFAVCEAPVAYGVDELNCALISDGIETFLQRNYVEAASNWIKVLDRKYDREAASIFRTRLLKLQIRA
jgi:hypothetical protein